MSLLANALVRKTAGLMDMFKVDPAAEIAKAQAVLDDPNTPEHVRRTAQWYIDTHSKELAKTAGDVPQQLKEDPAKEYGPTALTEFENKGWQGGYPGFDTGTMIEAGRMNQTPAWARDPKATRPPFFNVQKYIEYLKNRQNMQNKSHPSGQMKKAAGYVNEAAANPIVPKGPRFDAYRKLLRQGAQALPATMKQNKAQEDSRLRDKNERQKAAPVRLPKTAAFDDKTDLIQAIPFVGGAVHGLARPARGSSRFESGAIQGIGGMGGGFMGAGMGASMGAAIMLALFNKAKGDTKGLAAAFGGIAGGLGGAALGTGMGSALGRWMARRETMTPEDWKTLAQQMSEGRQLPKTAADKRGLNTLLDALTKKRTMPFDKPVPGARVNISLEPAVKRLAYGAGTLTAGGVYSGANLLNAVSEGKMQSNAKPVTVGEIERKKDPNIDKTRRDAERAREAEERKRQDTPVVEQRKLKKGAQQHGDTPMGLLAEALIRKIAADPEAVDYGAASGAQELRAKNIANRKNLQFLENAKRMRVGTPMVLPADPQNPNRQLTFQDVFDRHYARRKPTEKSVGAHIRAADEHAEGLKNYEMDLDYYLKRKHQGRPAEQAKPETAPALRKAGSARHDVVNDLVAALLTKQAAAVQPQTPVATQRYVWKNGKRVQNPAWKGLSGTATTKPKPKQQQPAAGIPESKGGAGAVRQMYKELEK